LTVFIFSSINGIDDEVLCLLENFPESIQKLFDGRHLFPPLRRNLRGSCNTDMHPDLFPMAANFGEREEIE